MGRGCGGLVSITLEPGAWLAGVPAYWQLVGNVLVFTSEGTVGREAADLLES